MLPFLLDDVARMKHDDLQREAAALELRSQATRGANGGFRRQRLRVRAGNVLVMLGSWLLGSGGAVAPMRLDNAR
jgi:hypothetical protein